MNDVCIGCSRCMVGFNRREGEFHRYGEEDQLTAILNCGDCPGASVVTRLAQLNLWNKPMGETPTKIHIAPCINHCPHKEELVSKIKEKTAVEVIEGAHPYMPENIFG